MFGHSAEHLGRFSNEELASNQPLELDAKRWNLQGHHGSAWDPECWSRPGLEHDLECSYRLRELLLGGSDTSLSGNYGSKKVCDEETSDCSKSNVMRNLLTHCRSTSRGKEVLDRQVAASSLRRLVGRRRGRSCNWNLHCAPATISLPLTAQLLSSFGWRELRNLLCYAQKTYGHLYEEEC